MPAPDYELTAGTISGEVRNEIFSKHGLSAYETAKYGWHHEHPSENVMKMYNLVNGNKVEFLLATITYPIIKTLKPTGSYYYEAEVSGSMTMITGSYPTPSGSNENDLFDIDVDIKNPSQLEFFWYDANIPFLDKYVADAQGLTYELK